MAHQGSDPEVKEWMREHPEEVGHLEKLYNGLRTMDFFELFMLAPEGAVAKAREVLVVGIIKASPEKAMAVLEGQGVLPEQFEDSSVSDDGLGRMGLRRRNKEG